MARCTRTLVVTLVLAGVAGHSGGASAAKPVQADPTAPVVATSAEEKRGAVIGGVVGGVLAGPAGAGFGAIVGGGIFGKLAASHRQNRELGVALSDVKSREQRSKREVARMRGEVTALNADLNRMVEIHATAFKDPQLPIQFRTGSSEVEAHYATTIDKVAAVLLRNQDARVNLAGYADRRGDAQANHKLSKARVEAVKKLLVARGVAEQQVVTAAFGESRPVVASESFENDFFDRRVVLELNLDINPQLATR